MKRFRGRSVRKVCVMILTVVMTAVALSGCGKKAGSETEKRQEQEKPDGIYLYGEGHANANIQKKELELWGAYYEMGMRDLFYEIPYYDAKLMNIWMKEDNDDVLHEMLQNVQGTAGSASNSVKFYQSIKKKYPETIWHGTDIGHDYQTSGQRYLDYLEKQGEKDSEEYQKTRKCMEQGAYYKDHEDEAYRENKMVENFIEEYETMKEAPIMGIYGAAHTDIEAMDYLTGTVPCMANQLYEKYGAKLHTENLEKYALITEPLKTEKMNVNGKTYQASYFGEREFFVTKEESDYEKMKYWRLEDAYQDFQDAALTGNRWEQSEFEMKLKAKQVYVVDLIKWDGTADRMYFRTDENAFEKFGFVREFTIE